jgi:hypothetical protein
MKKTNNPVFNRPLKVREELHFHLHSRNRLINTTESVAFEEKERPMDQEAAKQGMCAVSLFNPLLRRIL